MSKKAEGFSLRFVLINTGNISRKVLSKVLRSFDKNFERLQLVPKKLAMAMVDIFGAFCFNSGFSEKELRELEDIGMKLQEQALELFDE